MPNKDIFCNSPWYELHIFWDGSLAFCCHSPDRPYDLDQKNLYNIKNMTIAQWYDSPPMRAARLKVLGNDKWNHCNRCWNEEKVSYNSRRHRSNQKSVIFQQQFDHSLVQSPGWPKFKHSLDNQGAYDGLPIDVHIDLGNYCNLACKMCNPFASSRIATQHQRWGLLQEKPKDWTADDTVWQKFLHDLIKIPNLKNLHFMGGETLIQPRFRELIDFLYQNKRTDMCLSFVTNGTTFDQSLIYKLKSFQRVGIEVSIESLDEINDYVRQGTKTAQVLENIEKYLALCDQSVSVTLRPAPSLLTAKSYWQIIDYALTKQLVIKSILVTKPAFLDIVALPSHIKQLYKENYIRLIDKWKLDQFSLTADNNHSNQANYKAIASDQAKQIVAVLETNAPNNQDTLLAGMVEHCKKWDQIYDLDARIIYPELKEILHSHGY